ESQEITTNNWIESWHKTLKQKYLGHERQVRADYLLYLLQAAVNDIRMDYIKIKNGLLPLPTSKLDRMRKGRATAVPLERALQMVTPLLGENKVLN
ncbi:hypothetical protein BGW41_008258, partial [Actinomortierella wolfii]